MLNQLKQYLTFALCALLLNIALISPVCLMAMQEQSSQEETVQVAENNEQSDEIKTKKPTFVQSWRKVVTLRWKELTRADAWNIGAPIVGVAALGAWYYWPKNGVAGNPNNNPGPDNRGIPPHVPMNNVLVNNGNNNPGQIGLPIQPNAHINNHILNQDLTDNLGVNPNIDLVNDRLPREIETEIAWRRIGEFLLVPKEIQPGNRISSIAMDDHYLVTAQHLLTMNGSVSIAVKVWDISTGQLLHTFAGPNGHLVKITSLAVADHKVVTGSQDCTAKIWNIDTGEYEYTLVGHNSAINAIAIADNRVITGSQYGTVKVWDITTGNLLHDLSVPDDYYTIEHVLREAMLVGIHKVYNDGTVMTCDAITGDILEIIKSSSPIIAVGVHGDEVIAISNLHMVKIWNVHTGQFLNGCRFNTLSDGAVISGNKVVTRSSHSAMIFDIHTGEFLKTLQRPYNISSVAVSNDKVVAGSSDGKANVWDMHTGQLLYRFSFAGVGDNFGVFRPNLVAIHGDNVVVGATHLGLKIWPLCINLQVPELAPLLGIEHTLTIPQADFIARAYDAKKENQDFIIALPNNFNEIAENESQEQADGRTYFMFPDQVREYLRTRLRISK